MAVRALMVDRAAEGLVAAVLAPGLGDRLQFNFKGRAANGGKVIPHGPQLVSRQGQALLAADGFKGGIIEAVQRHRLANKM
ncbi:MAG: hypothetical protein EBS83_08730, partial [Planctomycetia bacterium]|nr:hypothetical protein [Planctomycetia bacterium]